MPIDIRCEHCHSSFQLADKALEKFAGKKVKCPTCKQPILVPGEPTSGSAGSSGEVVQSGQISAAQSTAQQRPPVLDKPAVSKPDGATAKTIATKKQAADKWYLQTEEGEQYGPVTKAELDQWLAEGRIDASCQILCEGWDQWRWAEDVYPELAGTPTAPVIDTGEGRSGSAAYVPVVAPLPAGQTAPVAIVTDEPVSGGISRNIRRSMQETRPWVMVLAVFGLIANGLSFLGGAIAVLAIAVATFGVGLIVAPLYLVSPILGLIASYLLLSYGMRIGDFCRRETLRELESAIEAQKSFWKFAGIVVLVTLGLVIATVLLVLVLGGLAALGLGAAARSMPR